MSFTKSNSFKASSIYPMGSVENPWKFHNQDFETLKQFHLEEGVLFTDEYFPANKNSIGIRLKNEIDTNNIEWKRPKDICKEPCFTVDGFNLSDIVQRRLGNCWVLSAIGSITMKPRLLEKIIPHNQGFKKRYAGIFHFRLWHLGEWMDIVIDDRLPFLDGKYLTVKPSCENEFWPCLLEKAYAKFLGSYENLHWGDPAGAFTNLTGGLTMTLDLKSTNAKNYWNMIWLASQDTMLACISDKQDLKSKNQNVRPVRSIGSFHIIVSHNCPRRRHLDVVTEDFHTNNVTESRQRIYVNNRRRRSQMDKLRENVLQENGIVERHAYTITDCAEVLFRNEVVRLIRLWNPWGSGEWKGDWSNRCPLWKEVSEKDRLRLQRINEDGEFWICWEDFINKFSKLIFCNQVPDFFDWGHQHKKWYKNMFRSQWTKENISWDKMDKDFFNKNPLYSIRVTASNVVKSGVNVVVSLMQASRNRHKYGDWLPIGFELFKFPGSQDKIPDSLLTPKNISRIKPCRKYSITEAYKLPAGRYGIIPYTAQKEHESQFLFQVFLKSEDCTE
ncbi:calpain-1 catalytic subunit-like [Ranitomeya variabilis]|uniref:calpain-1 catalytic subunit-like n=1 Tax=Ranitomeya variabilis TaxID=490064 RepID=UPI004056510D